MTNLETIAGAIPSLALIVMAIVALFFKSKSEKAMSEARQAKVKEADAPLAAKQQENEKKIEEVKNQDDSKLTPEERADRWNK